MTQVVLDPALFRKQFPAFSDAAQYTDECIQMYWDQATCYISDETNDCLSEKCLTLLINLLTAHLIIIGEVAATGGDTGLIKSSTIDDVSVTAEIPTMNDQFEWWINQTPYGKQYYALLASQVAGGFYVGGSADIAAFRNAAGGFDA